jgi:hypothetical protein
MGKANCFHGLPLVKQQAAQRERVVDEARGAFAHNAAVYVEQPGLTLGAARGAANIVIGVIAVSGR